MVRGLFFGARSAAALSLGVLLVISACDNPPSSEPSTPTGPARPFSSATELARGLPRRAPQRSPERWGAADIALLDAGLAARAYDAQLIAVQALRHAPARIALPRLVHALGADEPDVRAAALEALGRLHHPAAQEALRSVRDDSTEALDLRLLALAGLHSPHPSN